MSVDLVDLKSSNNPKNIELELTNKVNRIYGTQLSAHYSTKGALEWIPYNRFNDIKYIEKIGVYITNWIDGYVYDWDYKNQSWERKDQNIYVILKCFNIIETIVSEFENSKTTIHKIYGITQEPQTKNYMMILNNTCKKCNYECNVTHYQQDFKNWTSSNNDIDRFIQDTQLSAHKYTTSALEWIPYDRFYNIKYIAKGGFSKIYKANWIDGCLDANPSNRPKAEEIRDILYIWQYKSTNKQTIELQAQIKEADVVNNNSSNNIKLATCSGLSYKTHSEDTYTSRLLNFNNLPEPKNSDDYYKQNDNIISIETAVSLSQRNDVSRLNISDNNLSEQKNSVYEQNDDIISMECSESLQIDISQLNNNKDGKL
ncbi:kinase-like domain-containing protein [Rhizophagus irregularis DAOM 181602=DAOM 197198]|nr:kinase-like domain-containing protein [Rhizophagus irregularis DAOM 181602=DAOM 197198]